MDHIAADANRATVEKVPMATHQLTQKRGLLSGFTLATENANLSIEERKKLLENQKSENEMQIEQLREQHAQNQAKLHAQQEEKQNLEAKAELEITIRSKLENEYKQKLSE
jgi:DNA-binding transcriptional MerR regulator